MSSEINEPDLDDFYADLENVNKDSSTTTTTTTNTPSTTTTTTNSNTDNKNVENKLKRKIDEIDRPISTTTTTNNITGGGGGGGNKSNTVTTKPNTTTSSNKQTLIPPSLMKKKKTISKSPAITTSSPIITSPPSKNAATSTKPITYSTSTINAIAQDILYKPKTANYLNIAALKPQVTMEEPKKQTNLQMSAAGETWVDPTLSEWDENDFRIFVGDLGNDVTDDMLKQAFQKYPTFLKAKIIYEKSGKSKGFGFVSFSGSNDFLNAMHDMNGKYIGNRPIKLRKSKWKDRLVSK